MQFIDPDRSHTLFGDNELGRIGHLLHAVLPFVMALGKVRVVLTASLAGFITA